MEKDIAYYDKSKYYKVEVGAYAIIYPLGHKNVANGSVAKTSRVVSYDEVSGVFETKNTMYVPKED